MRLLLVEDEVSLADALAHILKKHSYEVDVFYDGEEGLDNAILTIYDLIILDRMLPSMNGTEILKQIRKEGITTPVIFLTAMDGISDRVDGLDCGADDYLVKPFSTEELLARIRALLRRKEKDLQDINMIIVGNVEFTPSTLMVRINEYQSKLTFKEGQLLEYLIMNKGHVLSKEKLFDKIWGFNSDSEFTIVEIYIHNLRKKVVVKGAKISIDTIRGIGYRLKEDV
ncbi:MAG: response regulator transcription factor [Clostridia bacterium]|nr:response regulator transcription factor [Clostridia bacterium]